MDSFKYDTIVVPAHPKGCRNVFLAEKKWPSLKIDKEKKKFIKYIAVYQTVPVSAITHFAEIREFIDLIQKGRYEVIFKGAPTPINPVRFTPMDVCAVQGPRYSTLNKILNASSLDQAF